MVSGLIERWGVWSVDKCACVGVCEIEREKKREYARLCMRVRQSEEEEEERHHGDTICHNQAIKMVVYF